MAIGTPTALGNNTVTSSCTGITITTTAPIVAGNLVVIGISTKFTNNPFVSTVSDGTNTYSIAKSTNDSGAAQTHCELWYKENASAVSSGATITITMAAFTSSATHSIIATAVQVSGVASSASLDSAAMASGTAGGTPISVATATLSTANEIVYGCLTYGTTLSGSGFTESAGFTNLFDLHGAGSAPSALGYKITGTTTAVTYAPTLSNSKTWTSVVIPFEQQGTATAVIRRRMLLGAGV